MADKTPEQMLTELGKPFLKNALKKRQGGGGRMFDYVETHTVIHRLNSATQGEWSFYVKDVQWRDDLLIVLGELTIPTLGTRSGFGVQKVSAKSGEDLVKGASSDALKKAATLFGVALELYGDDYEAIQQERRPRSAQQPVNAPKASPPAQTPAPTNLDRERENKRIHALLDHGMVRAALKVKYGLESTSDATAAQLAMIADLEEGKGSRESVTGWNAWKEQHAKLAATQHELLPTAKELESRPGDKYTQI